MVTIEEQIKSIEDEIQRTPYNKSTQHHIGKLKAKLARLRDELEKRRKISKGKTYALKKSGNATVAIVGFPSVGKSTLLNKITQAKSEVGDYDFTTLDVIPGVLEYKGAKIQVLDLPGLTMGASKGRGKGREVLSVVRNADLIILLIDVFETNLDILVAELYQSGIRLNQKKPEIVIRKTTRGGITVSATVPLTKIDTEMVRSSLREYGFINAEIVIREDINLDQLIDFISSNKVYIPAVAVLNKIDLVNEEYLLQMRNKFKDWNLITISAEKSIDLEILKGRIFNALNFIRVYMKPQGEEVDYKEPLIVRRNSTIRMVCDIIHRDFGRNFRYANVWGKSVKFNGQRVGLNHVLQDEDVLTIAVRG